jgi:tRNA(Ile)-lysidine synthase
MFKELNSDFIASFQKTQNYLLEAQTLVEDASIMVYQQVAKEVEDQIHFDLNQLKLLPNYTSYLYQWLNEYGFMAWEDIYNLVDSQSGKQVFSKDFRLLKDRDFLILSPIEPELEQHEYCIEKDQKEVKVPLNLSFCKVDDISVVSNTTIFVDEDALVFPLNIRKWQTGDVFHPFGMKGQSKKISKFFKDEKLSLLEKEKTWLLCSDNKIIWIVGLRQDERFKIKKTTKNILQITIL